MAYNRDFARSNGYAAGPYSQTKDRALDLVVASAICSELLSPDGRSYASKPRYILVSECGKTRRHRLPQWYDPLVRGALAAGGLLVVLSGPAGAQEVKENGADAALDAVLQDHQNTEADLVKKAEEEYLRGTVETFSVEQRKVFLKKAFELLNRAEGMTPGVQHECLRVQVNNAYARIVKGTLYYDLSAEEQKQIDKELSEPAAVPKQPQAPQTQPPEQSPSQSQPPAQTPEQPKPPQQPSDQQSKQPPAQPPAQPPVQPQAVPGQLILPDNPLFWSTITAASYKSLQTRESEAVLRTGLIDVYAQGHIRKDKEEFSGDRRRTQGAGGHAYLDIGFFEAGATGSYSKYRRGSNDSDTSSSGGVTITTNTEVLEEIEREYLALMAGFRFGDFRIRGTVRSATEKNSITTTVDSFVDSPDPIGDYHFRINDENDFDITTRGAQVLFGYDWAFKEDDRVLDAIRAKAVGDVEETEIGLNDTKYRTWRVDFMLDALRKNALWGASASVGTRLIEDAEEQSRYSRVHGSLNAAADLDGLLSGKLGIPVPATVFGSFWRLAQPGGGAGLVIGKGNAVKLMMDYANQRAWHELELSKELGPEERKVKMDLLNYDLLRGLTADPKLRLLLFGGARRNEDAGEHKYDWTAQAALVLPASKDVVVAIDGLRDKVGIEEIIRGGLSVKLPGGWRFGFWGGKYKVDGAKHDDAPIFGISGGVDF
ncbi:MAG: hypothetical protein QXT19_01085 [Candidatus Woesearchaeota archaeon]